MEQTILEQFNHWWMHGKVDADLALPFKRQIYGDIEKNMRGKFITALTGLRRVGKTTTIYQLIEKLLNEKVDKTSILFFSFDESSADLGKVIEKYRDLQRKDFREEKTYIFFDEIQKCRNWQNELKKYYDLYPKIKFVISGSESLFVRKRTKETLAGRIFEFILSPFTFNEYLMFKGLKEEDFKYETKIKPLFHNFIEKGGFPETFSFESEKEFREYLRALVVDKIVYKDIPSMFKIEDSEFLGVLMELISLNPGMYIDYLSLSRQFGKDRRVIKQYLFYLRESFLINLLGNYRKGGSASLRKNKRAYPADNGIIFLYKPKVEEGFLGRMVENAAINKLKAKSFWKNGDEIDIIYEDTPIEIKYQNKINNEDFKPLRAFMRKFSQKEGILVTKNEEREVKFEEGKIKLIPAWKWFLEK